MVTDTWWVRGISASPTDGALRWEWGRSGTPTRAAHPPAACRQQASRGNWPTGPKGGGQFEWCGSVGHGMMRKSRVAPQPGPRRDYHRDGDPRVGAALHIGRTYLTYSMYVQPRLRGRLENKKRGGGRGYEYGVNTYILYRTEGGSPMTIPGWSRARRGEHLFGQRHVNTPSRGRPPLSSQSRGWRCVADERRRGRLARTRRRRTARPYQPQRAVATTLSATNVVKGAHTATAAAPGRPARRGSPRGLPAHRLPTPPSPPIPPCTKSPCRQAAAAADAAAAAAAAALPEAARAPLAGGGKREGTTRRRPSRQRGASRTSSRTHGRKKKKKDKRRTRW